MLSSLGISSLFGAPNGGCLIKTSVFVVSVVFRGSSKSRRTVVSAVFRGFEKDNAAAIASSRCDCSVLKLDTDLFP